MNLGGLLISCTNSITGLATFGHSCSGERTKRFLSAMNEALKYSSGFCVSDLFPSMWFMDVVTGTRYRLRRAHRQLDQVFDEIIAEGEARARRRNAQGEDRDREGEHDLLSVLLRIRDEGDSELPITTINIKAIIVVSVVVAPFISAGCLGCV